MLIKKEFPILEFDESKEAFIEPTMKSDGVVFSNRLVISFFKEVIKKLFEDNKIFPLTSIRSEGGDLVIYKYVDYDCLIIHGKLGAPASAGFLEELIALGVNKVMFCGGGGVLKENMTLGKLIVVDSAVRDEGLSYHYVKPTREIKADDHVVKNITGYLDEKNIDYIKGKTWTTDAFFRETKEKIKLRKEEGCVVVEMEQSALMAVSQFRKIEYGAIIYGGDDLSKAIWDSRKWQSRTDIRTNLIQICRDIVLNM